MSENVSMDLSSELPDYRYDAAAYEVEERARPDEMLMIGRAMELALSVIAGRSSISVLDLCCGTGLSHENFVNAENVRMICGVDICENYLAYAQQKFSLARHRPKYVLGDAVTHAVPNQNWDVIMLCSAYHHIEDNRKVQFLKRVRALLGTNGRAFFAENILPDYVEGDPLAYSLAVKHFYTEVLRTAMADNPNLPAYVHDLIKRVAKYGVEGEYEYKVNYRVFKQHLREANLIVEHEERVWPEEGSLCKLNGGNYVLTIKAG